MKLRYYFVFLLLYPVAILAQETITASRIQYIPNVPVRHTSEIQVDFQQSMPGFALKAGAKQTINSVLTVLSKGSDVPIQNPPFDLSVVLKHLRVVLSVNDETTIFDTNQPDSSLYMEHLSKILERPILFHVGEGFRIEKQNEDFSRITQNFPLIGDFLPDILFFEMFQGFFPIAGQELAVGDKFRQEHQTGEWKFPIEMNYVIDRIDPEEIHAQVLGKVSPQTLRWVLQSEQNGQKEEALELSLSGDIQGDASWNRQNALIYNGNTTSFFNGTLRIGDWQWNIVLKIHTIASSQK
jgi:hypothetical protein